MGHEIGLPAGVLAWHLVAVFPAVFRGRLVRSEGAVSATAPEQVQGQRPDFIRACYAGTDKISALCRLFGISRKTGYKRFERFDTSDR